MIRSLCVLLVCCLVSAYSQDTTYTEATVYRDSTGLFSIEFGKQDSKGVVWGYYNKSVNVNGWNILSITATGHEAYSDNDKYYAAGFLEAAFSHEEIWDYFSNVWNEDFSNNTPEELEKLWTFVLDNDKWVQQQIAQHKDSKHKLTKSYWNIVGNIYAQLQGIVDGYSVYGNPNETMSRLDILIPNLDGDLYDLIPYLVPNSTMFRASHRRRLGHCSSLVRYDGSDLYAGHNTWESYQTMVRVYKYYNFPTSSESVSATQFSFSSYPGVVYSGDDFYVMDSGLWVTETTLQNYNMSLYSRLTIDSIMAFVRAMVANRIAGNGQEWSQIFSMHNSGTYNNEWVIVDYNLFKPSLKQLEPNTVWILEQIPGDTESFGVTKSTADQVLLLFADDSSGDVTNFVNKNGYWPSFNVPYFTCIQGRTMVYGKDIFDMLGFAEAEADNDICGQECSWTNCSRANIFRRDAPKVESVSDMQHIMRYNDWQTDPFSGGDPCNSIAARCDLSPFESDVDASGALDAKITSSELFANMQSMIIGGPTHQEQPVWVWSTSKWPNLLHEGEPDAWDFSWQLMDFSS